MIAPPRSSSPTSVLAEGLKVAIVGASVGGLGCANVLHRLGASVTVFESFPSDFQDRGGALGGVDPELFRHVRYGEGGGGRSPKTNWGQGYFYGDLWRYLADGLPQGKDSIIQFGVDVIEVLDADTDTPRLLIETSAGGDNIESASPRTTQQTTLGPFDLIVGADGGKSTIRKYVTGVLPAYSGYVLWRGLVPQKHIGYPPNAHRNWNGFTYTTLGYACPGPHGGSLWNTGVYIPMPADEVDPPTKNRQVGGTRKALPEWFLPFVKNMFDDDRTTKFWETCIQYGKVAPHAVWEMAADRVVSNRVVLLGDAAHMATPRTGAGAYTALHDALAMEMSFLETNQRGLSLDQALDVYNNDTVARGEQLCSAGRRIGSRMVPQSLELVSPAKVLSELQQECQAEA
jgi:2-polyprenyl-6-methoxyphenol hydroxylase-like FAD-dependent oxidoreductase